MRNTAIAAWLVLVYVAMAMATATAQGGAELDRRNNLQDAAIESSYEEMLERDANIQADVEDHKGFIAELYAADADLRIEIEALKARIEALENAEPPVVEPPAPSGTPVYIYQDGAGTLLESPNVTVSGPFNICLTEADALPPVRFEWPGGQHTENNPLFCVAGSDNGTDTSMTLPVGQHNIDIWSEDIERFTITVTVEGEPPVVPVPPAGGTDTLLQVGVWSPSPSNTEEPFINIVHASPVSWRDDGVNTQELYDLGIINPETGLPREIRNGWMTSDVYFPENSGKAHWDGSWVLEWETVDPDCASDLSMHFLPSGQQQRVGPHRVEFTRTVENYHNPVAIRELECELTSLAIFRTEYEPAYRAGYIYNPIMVNELRKYDVVRTLDLQEANRSAITKLSDVATIDSTYWNNIAWTSQEGIAHPLRSLPLEAVVAHATEADTMLWHQAPLELGAPKQLLDPSITVPGDVGATVTAWRDLARDNADAILASDEWDKYADAFVAALEVQGYPEGRTLYTSIGNEAWNYSYYYVASVHYAQGVGEAMVAGGQVREGYGILLARWKVALDAAFERAGRNQDVIYVVEGQTANRGTTYAALTAMRGYLAMRGEDWDAHKGDLGVSVASYWGRIENWKSAGSVDEWRNPTPEFFERVENQIINGPDNETATLPWILKRFEEHKNAAAEFGVPLIGAYEGGSHLEKPSEMPSDAYAQWHWGEAGARINTAVNRALAEAYPGIILSNYVLAGPAGGQPWFEGEYDKTNPFKESWEEFQRD